MDSAIPLFAIGLVGSLVMFAGDMLLYFTPGSYDMDGTLRPYARIMRDLPEGRVRAGGVLGPVAAFLYVVGFAGLPLLAEGDLAWLAWLTAGLLSFALICGGAYHAQYPYLAIAARTEDDSLVEQVAGNIMALQRLATVPMYAAFVLFGIAVVAGQTALPPWSVVLTPFVTSFLGFLWLRMPQPARCVLFGGWSNLVFTIMFAMMLVFATA